MAKNERPYLVIIDPGHGGGDPGAVNDVVKLKESDINLQVALLLERHVLDGDYLFRPYLTHRGAGMSLEGRCNLANGMKPDAFVSIHVNSAENKEARGYEVWTSKGQTSADSLATEIFWALQTSMPQEHGRSDYDDGDVDKEKNFYVLRHTEAPAVLIELDFISNDERAEWLAHRANQEVLVREIAQSIEFWLEGGK